MEIAIPNVRHMAAFLATVDHGSATRAAEAIHLTQPALTQAIAGLERSLGCALFEREPSGMRATAPALVLAPYARRALENIGSPRITSTQIHAFLALVRAGSYQVAAQHSGLAAASLHRAVNDLSAALGEKLVERRGRHIFLTKKGAARARGFGLAAAELRHGFGEVASWMGKAGSRIVIGAMPLSRANWLPRALLAFSARYPHVAISVLEGSFGELAGPLRDGEIDFLLGASRDGDVIDDLEQEVLFIDRPQVIMRADHPLAGCAAPALDDLLAYPWILPSTKTPLRRYWQDMIENAGGIAPAIAVECGSVITIRELLMNSDALSLLSPDQVRVEIAAGLVVAHAPPVPVERSIGIITRRDWHQTSSQKAMLADLRQIARDIS